MVHRDEIIYPQLSMATANYKSMKKIMILPKKPKTQSMNKTDGPKSGSKTFTIKKTK